jgi:hypothetical protein
MEKEINPIVDIELFAQRLNGNYDYYNRFKINIRNVIYLKYWMLSEDFYSVTIGLDHREEIIITSDRCLTILSKAYKEFNK